MTQTELADSARRVLELVKNVVESLDLEAEIDLRDDGRVVRVDIVGEDLGLIIGKHGQTIDAVQYLAWLFASQAEDVSSEGQRPRVIVVDASGYRNRRSFILRKQADRAASDALRFQRPVSLDAMTSTERRFVHDYIQKKRGVSTYSEGSEPDRHIVVAPE